jgi:hypothetical protein
MTSQSTTTKWKVLVAGREEAWLDTGYVSLDAADDSDWKEAWDGIVPGYQCRIFESEKEANALALRLRGVGYITATEPAD